MAHNLKAEVLATQPNVWKQQAADPSKVGLRNLNVSEICA